ncbi:GNAT family N-acetyltransferase [Ramlibacter sp. USB13]|uniref:GNAT family N-acetyltransferase n=1 Tax=Ramlibacter cellulosilyticus TaxID=2764187 RepID=A0A923MW47_9BURK|nr:GNAT family N-acetyltransferase [Ramlibacter cellulosilyticus]MBC5784837.1 GNAT family N-acetyltransferase [Ramlibacter cellulosilyticus]
MPTTASRAHADVESLEALEAEWEALWREDASATPFQSPHWLLPWWRHVGKGEERALAVRDDDGRLMGLAPLYVYTDAGGRRHLFPVGIGTTDYLGLLARQGWEKAVAEAVLERVMHWRDWDVLEWPQLQGTSALLSLPGVEVIAGEPNPVLALQPPAAIPKSTLANLRTCRNRAARAGTITYELADAGTIPAYLDALARLHASRWKERGLPGVLADEAVRASHAEAAPRLHAAGVLRLHGLRLDGELVAVLHVLMHRRRCYYYIGGFDPRHAAFSPGSLLLAHAIGEAAREGAKVFDFLRGAEAYKYRWGALDQPMFTLRVRGGLR